MIVSIIKSVFLTAILRPQKDIVRQYQCVVQAVGGAFEQFFLFYLLVDIDVARVAYCIVLGDKIAVVLLLIFSVRGTGSIGRILFGADRLRPGRAGRRRFLVAVRTADARRNHNEDAQNEEEIT